MATPNPINNQKAYDAAQDYFLNYPLLQELSEQIEALTDEYNSKIFSGDIPIAELKNFTDSYNKTVSNLQLQYDAIELSLADSKVILLQFFEDNDAADRIYNEAFTFEIVEFEGDIIVVPYGVIPTPTPQTISDLLMWQRGDAGVLATGSLVDTWEDKSGNGYDLAASALFRPTYDTVNQCISFSGSVGFISSGIVPFSVTEDVTVFVVVNNETTGAGMLVELSANYTLNNAFGIEINNAADGDIYIGDNGDFGIDDMYLNGAKSAPILVRGEVFRSNAGKGAAVYINGSNVGEVSPSTENNTITFGDYAIYMGSRGNSSLWFTGDIYEFLVYSRKLTTDEITTIENYLTNKYL
jgi:hypothetical protein